MRHGIEGSSESRVEIQQQDVEREKRKQNLIQKVVVTTLLGVQTVNDDEWEVYKKAAIVKAYRLINGCETVVAIMNAAPKDDELKEHEIWLYIYYLYNIAPDCRRYSMCLEVIEWFKEFLTQCYAPKSDDLGRGKLMHLLSGRSSDSLQIAFWASKLEPEIRLLMAHVALRKCSTHGLRVLQQAVVHHRDSPYESSVLLAKYAHNIVSRDSFSLIDLQNSAGDASTFYIGDIHPLHALITSTCGYGNVSEFDERDLKCCIEYFAQRGELEVRCGVFLLTPLEVAAAVGHIIAVQLLIEQGANAGGVAIFYHKANRYTYKGKTCEELHKEFVAEHVMKVKLSEDEKGIRECYLLTLQQLQQDTRGPEKYKPLLHRELNKSSGINWWIIGVALFSVGVYNPGITVLSRVCNDVLGPILDNPSKLNSIMVAGLKNEKLSEVYLELLKGMTDAMYRPSYQVMIASMEQNSESCFVACGGFHYVQYSHKERRRLYACAQQKSLKGALGIMQRYGVSPDKVMQAQLEMDVLYEVVHKRDYNNLFIEECQKKGSEISYWLLEECISNGVDVTKVTIKGENLAKFVSKLGREKLQNFLESKGLKRYERPQHTALLPLAGPANNVGYHYNNVLSTTAMIALSIIPIAIVLCILGPIAPFKNSLHLR